MATAGVNADITTQLKSIQNDFEPKKLVDRFLKVAGQAMKSDVQENFNNASSPNLQAWAGLAMPRPFGGTKPLNNFGLLRASFVSGKGHVERTDANSVTIGSNRPGVNLMHFGGTVYPTKAKALAIPVTREAAVLNTPRIFPRKLFMIWKPGAKSGVLAEWSKPKKKRVHLKRGRGQVLPWVSEHETNRLETKIVNDTNALAAESNAKKRATIQKRINANRVRLVQAKSRPQQSTTATRSNKRQLIIHYILKKWVVIPPRPIVGFGKRLTDRLAKVWTKIFGDTASGSKP